MAHTDLTDRVPGYGRKETRQSIVASSAVELRRLMCFEGPYAVYPSSEKYSVAGDGAGGVVGGRLLPTKKSV